MALVLEAINLVKERARLEARKPGPAESLRALWKHMQSLKNPDLKLAPYNDLKTADVIVSDAACTLYCIFAQIPSTQTIASWLKISDSASAAGAMDVGIKFGTTMTSKQTCPIYIDGVAMTNGATIGSHTANNGTTKSENADAATGFVIVG